MPARKDITGKVYGKLTVLTVAVPLMSKGGRLRHRYLCRCTCGDTCVCLAQNLASGRKSSCGCDTSERMSIAHTTHGHSMSETRTPTYESWASMIKRCNPNNKGSEYHGQRGIRVCARWHSFSNFLQDMGERKMGWSIDRINNNKGYNIDNCRWLRRNNQTKNQRRNHIVYVNGKPTYCAFAAKLAGVSWPRMHKYIQRYGSQHAYAAALTLKKFTFGQLVSMGRTGEIERFAKAEGWVK